MPTKYKGGSRSKLALDAFIKLMRAANSLASRVARCSSFHGLTASQLGVLEALYHLGPLNQTEISQKLLKSTGNITVVIDHLEKRDLVQRCRNSDDRRFVTVSLTAQGKREIEKAFPAHVEAIVGEFDVLTEKEQLELAELCKKIGLRNKQSDREVRNGKA